MDQATLVADRVEDGRKLIDRLSHGHIEVSAALWLYAQDEDRWSLTIVSPSVDAIGLKESYREVIRAIASLPGIQIESDEVTLLRPNHPVSTAVLEFMARYPAPLGTRLRGTYIGNVFVDQAYVYSVKEEA